MLLDKVKEPQDIQNFSTAELQILAEELRIFLIDHIAKTGGHLASNLGIVELTLALLKCFDFEKDKIIFDVGHQCYVYKILTKRKDQFPSLRQYQGLSGFPKRNESPYDFFDTGHSATSISAALGMARARDLKKENYQVIALIGDGALTGGMAYEALNDIGFHKTKILIILNDNEMSISPNVGGMANYLNKIRIRPFYHRFKKKVHYQLEPNNHLLKFIHNIKTSFKHLFLPSMFFEDLGLTYIGPIDGHNLKEMISILNKIQNFEDPIVLHVKTKKGLGYIPALTNPNTYHAIGPFSKEKGIQDSKKVSYSSTFGDAMVSIAQENKDLVVITAAMKEGTGLEEFATKFPDHFLDVGIAEEHAVTLAAGLACSGMRPVLAVYSTFLQRGFDQILHDVCMQNLPVIFAIDRAGLVGNDGQTHQGVFDLSFLSIIPNIMILAPKCIEEIEPMFRYALSISQPVAIRYPKGENNYFFTKIKKDNFTKWQIVSKGNNIVILAVGRMVEYACHIKEKCKKDIMVVHANSVKPLDHSFLLKLVKSNYDIITMEDNIQKGGFGEQVTVALQNLNYHKSIHIFAYPDHFIEQGNIEQLLKKENMDIESIIHIIKKL